MELLLQREPSSDGATIGRFFVNGTFFGFSCEDVTRAPGVKIPGETAIPPGRYRVLVNMSQRFGRPLPYIVGVQNFTGVRIHPGNSSKDTAGCILIGLARTPNTVLSSNAAMDRLLPRIQRALQSEDVFITIENAPAEEKRLA